METVDYGTDIEGIKEDLKTLIVQRLKLDIDPVSIQDDAPLFAGGTEGAGDGLALDSVEALEIVVGIEEKWGIVIQDDSVASEFFSIATLANLVSRLLREASGEAASA